MESISKPNLHSQVKLVCEFEHFVENIEINISLGSIQSGPWSVDLKALLYLLILSVFRNRPFQVLIILP